MQKVSYTLVPQDIYDFWNYYDKKEHLSLKQWLLFTGIFIGTIILVDVVNTGTISVLQSFLSFSNITNIIIFFVGIFLLPKLIGFLQRKAYVRWMKKSKKGSIFVETTLLLSEKEVTFETNESKIIIQWNGLQSVCETSHAFYLFMNKKVAHIVPKRFLTSEQVSFLHSKSVER